MNPKYLIVVPGSILYEDGGYTSANTEDELKDRVQEWKDMGFSEVVVYEQKSTH